MKGDRVEIVIDAGSGTTRTYDVAATRAGRKVNVTHGRGVAMAPVNRIDASGRPSFVVGGLPVRGLEPPLERPEIYHGAQPDMPFAIVNTDQPDGFTDERPATWDGAASTSRATGSP